MGQCGGSTIVQKHAHITDTFTKTSLILPKSNFYSLNDEFALPSSLDVREIALNSNSYQKRLRRYGKPWAWERRPKYQSPLETIERISDDRSNLFGLYLNGQEIGYSLTIPRDDLSTVFDGTVSEIENIAIAVEHNGSGHGSPFFKHVCNKLFSQGSDYVYLTTRSTNHPKVIPFYERHGMKVIHQETCANDLK